MKKTYAAWIDDRRYITVDRSLLGDWRPDLDMPVLYNKKTEKNTPAKKFEKVDENSYKVYFSGSIPLNEPLSLLWGQKQIPVYPGKIVRTEWFDEQFDASHVQFGAICTPDETVFRLWAPTATGVKLLLNDKIIDMERKEKGIWEKLIKGDWHGAVYEYLVTVNGKTNSVTDPYAKSALANSAAGVVIDLKRTEQMTFPRPKIENLQDAIIYELHVRDATVHENSGIKQRGKFLGLAEEKTKTKNGYSTGLQYIKELGVTHVEILPVNDFARVDERNPGEYYNWGYDPVLYQVPEGSYATNPDCAVSRINECKRMIDTFHKHGIGVILDVVFNHVYIEKEISETIFEKIVPGYYFRFHNDGTVANGTGCGNELATERKMVKKFILDTVDYWLREFKADGFRFDLMGIMDIETMRKIRDRCLKEPVPIVLLGEGWNLVSPLPENRRATIQNANCLTGIKFFNDLFRDTLKGNVFQQDSKGYVNGNGKWIEKLPLLVSGSCIETYGRPYFPDVAYSVNYVECHDNLTLWDKLSITNIEENENVRKKMHQLATGITLVSQGVPFLHAGQEWFRTKYGVENSYLSGDEINQLDWTKREEEAENIEFIKALIRLRKQYSLFRLRSKEKINRRLYFLKTDHPVFGFALLGDTADFAVYTNPSKNRYNIVLPSPGKWKIIISNELHKTKKRHLITNQQSSIDPYEFIIFMREFS